MKGKWLENEFLLSVVGLEDESVMACVAASEEKLLPVESNPAQLCIVVVVGDPDVDARFPCPAPHYTATHCASELFAHTAHCGVFPQCVDGCTSSSVTGTLCHGD